MVRCKTSCISVTDFGTQQDVVLRPIYDPNPESPNHQWSKATPGGEIKLSITNPGAFKQFKAGSFYFVDFNECQKDDTGK